MGVVQFCWSQIPACPLAQFDLWTGSSPCREVHGCSCSVQHPWQWRVDKTCHCLTCMWSENNIVVMKFQCIHGDICCLYTMVPNLKKINSLGHPSIGDQLSQLIQYQEGENYRCQFLEKSTIILLHLVYNYNRRFIYYGKIICTYTEASTKLLRTWEREKSDPRPLFHSLK